MSTIVVHDTGLKDRVKVLAVSAHASAEEIQNLINKAIDELGGLKVLSISTSVLQDGVLIVVIHHLAK